MIEKTVSCWSKPYTVESVKTIFCTNLHAVMCQRLSSAMNSIKCNFHSFSKFGEENNAVIPQN